MGDLLLKGMRWLNERHEAAVSQPIIYRRGKQAVALNATVGTVNMLLGPEFGGTQIRKTDKVFILNDPTKLVICGQLTTPKTGDQIELVEGGNTSRYQVRPPSEGEPEFSWDDMRTSMRIHTQFLELTNGCAT